MQEEEEEEEEGGKRSWLQLKGKRMLDVHYERKIICKLDNDLSFPSAAFSYAINVFQYLALDHGIKRERE